MAQFKKNYELWRMADGDVAYGAIDYVSKTQYGWLVKGMFSDSEDATQKTAISFFAPNDALGVLFEVGAITQNGTYDDGNPKYSVHGKPLVIAHKSGRDAFQLTHKGYAGNPPVPGQGGQGGGGGGGFPGRPAPSGQTAPRPSSSTPSPSSPSASPARSGGSTVTFANMAHTFRQCHKAELKILASLGLVAVKETVKDGAAELSIDFGASALKAHEIADILTRGATTLFIQTVGRDGPGPLPLPSASSTPGTPGTPKPETPAEPIIKQEQLEAIVALLGQANLTVPVMQTMTANVPGFPKSPEPLKWTEGQGKAVVRWLEAHIAAKAQEAASNDIPF